MGWKTAAQRRRGGVPAHACCRLRPSAPAEKGQYPASVALLEKALREEGPFSQLGGEIQMWLALAYQVRAWTLGLVLPVLPLAAALLLPCCCSRPLLVAVLLLCCRAPAAVKLDS